MIRIGSITPALAAALGVLCIAPGAVASPPSPQGLTRPPPDFESCMPCNVPPAATPQVRTE